MGSVGAFFSILIASRLAEFDVLKRPFFCGFSIILSRKNYGRVLKYRIKIILSWGRIIISHSRWGLLSRYSLL